MKAKSIGFLLGRLLIFAHKIVQEHKDNPLMTEEVKEAKSLIMRWNSERKCK